jgi:hypothetical protein
LYGKAVGARSLRALRGVELKGRPETG